MDPANHPIHQEPPTADFFSVTVWKSKAGLTVEEFAPPFGQLLPADIPRFVGSGIALIEQIGAPPGSGIQVPYRFRIEDAADIAAAFAIAAVQNPLEAKKAYDTWVKRQQEGQKLIAPPNGFRAGHGPNRR